MPVISEMPRYVRACIYGEFGKGKTVTAGLYNPNAHFFATDGGWASLLNHGMKDVDIIPYTGLSQLRDYELQEGETYVLDTVSEMVEQYIDLLLEHATWGGRERTPIGSSHEELENTSAPAPADYHVTRNKFRPVFRKFLTGPWDVFMLSHKNAPIEGLSKNLERRPGMPDKVYKAMAQNLNIMAHITNNPGKGFQIDVEGNNLLAAKNQIKSISGKMSPEDFVAALQDWKKGNV